MTSVMMGKEMFWMFWSSTKTDDPRKHIVQRYMSYPVSYIENGRGAPHFLLAVAGIAPYSYNQVLYRKAFAIRDCPC